MKKNILTFIFILFWFSGFSQIIFGQNNFAEYHKGNLPIIISVPHDGSLNPSSIADRTCNNPTFAIDANTRNLAKFIDTALFLLTGCHPHLIFCNLKRSKLDCNRNKSDGACGNILAENAWTDFHNFIDSAQLNAQNNFGGKAFYIDLHGHGHSVQQLELGYLLTASELDFSDGVLNSPEYVGYSSIQNLVANNVNSFTHSELLRGTFAFGTLMANAGYPSVPSLQTPSLAGNPYFSGGYNTANHTSYAIGNSVNGFQLESNFNNIRDNYSNQKRFGDSIAKVMLNYLEIHENINLLNCGTSGFYNLKKQENIFIYPTILTESNWVKIEGIYLNSEKFTLYNSKGQEVESGFVNSENKIFFQKNLNKGLYLIKIKSKPFTFKLMFN